MSITGATAKDVKGDANIFYDSEILAIVHRAKMKSSSLVETTLWGWEGRRSQIGEREQRKLKDMARHYGTKLYPVKQGCEPPELAHTLGGRLATRQVRLKNYVRQWFFGLLSGIVSRAHVRIGARRILPCTKFD